MLPNDYRSDDAAAPGHTAAFPATRRPRWRPRVVVVGIGFGGLSAAKALAATPAEIILIDRRNYHLFQPLLYQVATAALSPADIAWPIRAIVARQQNTSVQLGRVTGVDTASCEVLLDE
jgi:NADH dehydrogenase